MGGGGVRSEPRLYVLWIHRAAVQKRKCSGAPRVSVFLWGTAQGGGARSAGGGTRKEEDQSFSVQKHCIEQVSRTGLLKKKKQL